MRMRNQFAGALGVGVLVGLSVGGSPALAQDAGAAKPTAGTDVTPSLRVEGFWRSNLYLQEGETGGGEPTTSGVGLRARPSLDLKSRSRQVQLDLGLDYSAQKMLTPGTTNLDRFNFFGGDLDVVLLPESVVGLKVQDRASLSGRETEATSATDAYLMMFRNQGQGTVTVRPGSSLELDLGGQVENRKYTLSECIKDPNGCQSIEGTPTLNERLAYGFLADMSWKFFPKTAVVARYERNVFAWGNNFVNVQGDGLNTEELGAYLGIPDGKAWRLSGGLRGRFTEKLVLGAVIGYSSMTFDEQTVIDDASNQGDALPVDVDAAASGFDADQKGLLASVEVGYDITENQRVVFSYGLDYEDVFFTNYVGFNRFVAAYKGKAADKFGYNASFMFRNEDYDGEVDRSDNFLKASLDLDYALNDWFSIVGGTYWMGRRSADGSTPSIEFDDVGVNAGINLSY